MGRGLPSFYSGFRPVDAVLDKPPTFSIRINDSDPIFFYCSQPGACNRYGMVGVINPVRKYLTPNLVACIPLTPRQRQNSSTSLTAHREAALRSEFSLSPGEPWPGEYPYPSLGSSSSIARSSTATGASHVETSQPTHTASGSNSGGGISGGAIAGIVIAALTSLIILLGVAYLIGRVDRLGLLKREIVYEKAPPTREPSQYHEMPTPLQREGYEFPPRVFEVRG